MGTDRELDNIVSFDGQPLEGMTETELEPETPKLRLAFTPYRTEALSELIEKTNNAIAELGEGLAKYVREVIDDLVSIAGQISGPLFEKQLYYANDNPRWWHLYKHAKKARTRKKYRRLLMKQLLRNLSEAEKKKEAST